MKDNFHSIQIIFGKLLVRFVCNVIKITCLVNLGTLYYQETEVWFPYNIHTVGVTLDVEDLLQ